MRKKCKICGRILTAEDNYTITVKQNNKEIGAYDVCVECLECNCLVDSRTSDLQDDLQVTFEEIFGNPYIGSDFI